MKLHQRILPTLLASLVLLFLMACSQTPEAVPPKSVLILYGSPVTASATRSFPNSFNGVSTQAFTPSEASRLYATMLANLLGRYPDLRMEIKPVSSYEGLGENVRVFYIGSIYDEAIPEALLNDAASGKPITWMGYNLWKLGNNRQTSLGLQYQKIITASSAAEVDSGYNRVRYRDYLFQKLTRSGSNPVPSEIIEVKKTAEATVVEATAEKPSGETIPYAIRNNRFWYIADIPFTYTHERDRYLVFADLLGPMLERGEVCEARALLRLEDVNPLSKPNDLKTALDVLERQQAPFNVAAIPLYQDGVNKTSVNWADKPEALEQLRRAERLRGRILQNGYTHQFQGITASDGEFLSATNQPNMSADETVQRIENGKKILRDLGLNPVAFLTPNNAMPPAYYERVNLLYPRFFERRLYQVGQDFQGQFFPFPLRDISGALIVPENTNFIGVGRSPADIMEVAKANRALRCPWLGLAFNPILLSTAANQGGVSAQEFEKMLADIRNLGYTFVDINSVDTK